MTNQDFQIELLKLELELLKLELELKKNQK